MRGAAVPEVILLPDGTCSVRGVLPDGVLEYAYTLGPGVGPPGALVGRLERPAEGEEEAAVAAGSLRFVKAWVPSTRRYVLCRMANAFTCEYSEASEEEAARLVGA